MKFLRIVGLTMTIILAFTGYIVANDQGSRKRDDCIQKDFNAHVIKSEKQFHSYAMEQQKVNTRIMVVLEGVAKDIEYIKQAS